MDAKLKSHFINIYCMILADGKVEQKELNRMYEIGTTGYGVTPEEINKVLLSGDIVFYKPESEEERVLYLYDLACVSVSDEVIPAAERVLLENYARKFDVEDSQITVITFFRGARRTHSFRTFLLQSFMGVREKAPFCCIKSPFFIFKKGLFQSFRSERKTMTSRQGTIR